MKRGNYSDKIGKVDDNKDSHLCFLCKKNESTAMYYRYIYVISGKHGRSYPPNIDDDKVSSTTGFICNECIEEYKKDGYLTDHIEDIDYGGVVAFKNKKSDIVFSPYTKYNSNDHSITDNRLFFGINYVAPFGNGIDKKIKPRCFFSHNENKISINFTDCKTKDFLRTAEIIFLL